METGMNQTPTLIEGYGIIGEVKKLVEIFFNSKNLTMPELSVAFPKDGVDIEKDFPHAEKGGVTPFYTSKNAEYALKALDKALFCIGTAGLDEKDHNRCNMIINANEKAVFAKVFITNASFETEARENWKCFTEEIEKNGFSVVEYSDEEMKGLLSFK